MHPFDPYLILGVTRGAGPAAIKAAYRRRVHVVHPDRGGDAADFIGVVKAFGVLSNPEAKRLFDETGRIDEQDARNYQNEVAVLLADMFDTAVRTAVDLRLSLGAVNFIAQMGTAVRSNASEAEKNAKRLDTDIEALIALRSRIRRSDGSPNMFVERLNGQIAKKTEEYAAIRRRVALLGTALTELENYRDEVELISALEIVGAGAPGGS